mmetsp:Transcript_4851/g.7176  ORF Transcript_4851/g.7176 Transcript_4851/m.7176 type:complete len:190 (-) Transcript_4851:36-605(-)
MARQVRGRKTTSNKAPPQKKMMAAMKTMVKQSLPEQGTTSNSNFADYVKPVPYPPDFKPERSSYMLDDKQFLLEQQRPIRLVDNSYREYIEGTSSKPPATMLFSHRFYSAELVKGSIHPVAPYTETEFLVMDLDEMEDLYDQSDVKPEEHINEDDHSEYSMAMQRDDDEGMGDDEQLGGITTEYDSLTM